MKKTRIFSFLLTTICIASQAQAPLADSADQLRSGLYIFNGKKTLVK